MASQTYPQSQRNDLKAHLEQRIETLRTEIQTLEWARDEAAGLLESLDYRIEGTKQMRVANEEKLMELTVDNEV